MKMSTLRPEVREAARTLGETLARTRYVRAYQEARAQMEDNTEASTLLEELQQMQARFRVRQNNGGITHEDLERLRALQRQVQSHPLIGRYLETQQVAQSYLPSANREISNWLGLDFASLAGSGCC